MKRPSIMYAALLVALALTILVSLRVGSVAISWSEVLASLAGRDAGSGPATIVVRLRLPRIFSAGLVGGGLALAGAVLQALLRNPLAEPFTLGISGGAGFAVTALAAFLPGLYSRPYLPPLAGFSGALVAGFLVFLLAHRQAFTNTALILCGVILSFFFGSLVMINFAFGRPESLQSAMAWLGGDFSRATGVTVVVTALGLLVPVLYVFSASQALDVLGLGEERAFCLGLPVARVRRLLYAAAALLTGICVACAGVIAFVGFLMPHLARFLVGARHRHLLSLAALAGAVFLIISDTLARTLFRPLEVPVGAFTGLIGAVFFLVYYWRGQVRDIP